MYRVAQPEVVSPPDQRVMTSGSQPATSGIQPIRRFGIVLNALEMYVRHNFSEQYNFYHRDDEKWN